ncbi:type II secretion system F family protein [Patescibacteria group bacterium]|nr:type II secretion system F family protein [Patescibacteria group bacterium]MBU2159021.1 type II secretion system F family protein [Patescibacteria group bacterium]MBU2220553.1 type II secretion system F family protein [Patescibacteria group bacterium]
MKFRVTVKTAEGSEEKRVVDAASRFGVYSEIEKEGATVLSVEEGAGTQMPKWTEITIGSGVKMDERITFTKNLAAMISAGLTLSRALSVIERQSTNKALKRIVIDLEERVKKGDAFHEGLAAHSNVFSELFIAMTKAGEESGTLAESLSVVARQMEKANTLQKKVKGAMIYPSIILSAVIVIGILMLMYVVPTLSNTFKELGVELPAATRAIVGASDFMANNVILVFILLGASFGGLFFFLKSKIGGKTLLFVSLRLPIIGELVRETMSARGARALSSLLSSGVEMLSALKITSEVVGDNVFGKVVDEAAERVRKGEALSAAFTDHPKLYPLFVADMIAVGEETGKVADMLGQVAQYYETDVEDRTKDLSTIIEPVLMLFIGTVVGIFAMSMISPIYSLSDKI